MSDTKACAACLGTGYKIVGITPTDDPCPACNGTGQVPKLTSKFNSHMKHIIFILSLFTSLTATAQKDTIAPKQPAPLVSQIVGQQNFQTFAIFDSTNTPMLRYQSTGKDTLQVSWGVTFIFCEKCAGERLFVRTVELIGPGITLQLYGVPAKNDNPAYDEAWETTQGALYLSLAKEGITAAYLKQPNGYSIRWSAPAPLSPEKPK